MKINVVMTKDKMNHKSFLVMIPKHSVRRDSTILQQMEKYTEVPWRVNEDKSNHKYLAVETGELTNHFLTNHPDDEKAYVNWRLKWKNQKVSIATGR